MKQTILYLFIITAILSIPAISTAACTVSTTSVNFGSYDVFLTTPLDATGTLTVSCDEKKPPRDPGEIGPSSNSGGYDPRMMKLTTGSDLLSYNLYTNNNRTKIWGDGSGSTNTVSKKVSRKKPWVSTVYGRIPPGQDVSVGSYNETLTVTITW
jgi:spore coat protein U-like protein